MRVTATFKPIPNKSAAAVSQVIQFSHRADRSLGGIAEQGAVNSRNIASRTAADARGSGPRGVNRCNTSSGSFMRVASRTTVFPCRAVWKERDVSKIRNVGPVKCRTWRARRQAELTAVSSTKGARITSIVRVATRFLSPRHLPRRGIRSRTSRCSLPLKGCRCEVCIPWRKENKPLPLGPRPSES